MYFLIKSRSDWVSISLKDLPNLQQGIWILIHSTFLVATHISVIANDQHYKQLLLLSLRFLCYNYTLSIQMTEELINKV